MKQKITFDAKDDESRFNKERAAFIREYREENDLTMQGFADIFNNKYGLSITVQNIQSYESVTVPKRKFMAALAHYLGFESVGKFVIYLEERMKDRSVTLPRTNDAQSSIENVITSLDVTNIDSISINIQMKK